jgi:CRISPR-associated exonuclease Cas4
LNRQTGDIGQATQDLRFTGSQINYYFICKRKLWLFSHNIELEPESDLVKLGALLHQNSYKRKMKEVQVDRIKIDFIENKRTRSQDQSSGPETQVSSPELRPIEKHHAPADRELVIHEVKRSKKMQDAHLYQLLYYMYYLSKNYGVNSTRGALHYPLLNQNVDVPLTEERIKQIEYALRGIEEVNSQPRPPEAEWKRYCRSCAYADLCWG